ncbi:MAG: hypothetical protein JO051_03760 [Acidobacteriaceae bacterium]|nr:hypothetical protein [Acidobacteriaceae bacterium]
MKAKVAQNRTTHGLCGRFQVLPCEDQAEYNDLLNRFMDAENPVDDVERELVAKMARHTWVSDRAQRCQDGCFVVLPQSPEDEANRQDDIAVRDELDRYMRYQTAHDRAYQRAANDLAKRRNERRKAEIGFESKKRREAEELRHARQEERRDAKENRDQDLHKVRIATGEMRLQLLGTKVFAASAAAGQQLSPLETRKTEKIAA